jgi:ribosome recycling factor
MSVEPEKGEQVARRVREVCRVWREKVREEVHKRGETHKKWKAGGVVLSDDLFRLKGMVQKVQDERMKGILVKEKEVVAAVLARG